MSFSAKSEILSAIAKTDDPAMKTVLLLMLGVFEEIGGKIDSVLKNEQVLRQTVLNGHAVNHDRDHEWLDRRIKRDEKMDLIIGWAENKIIKEREAEEDHRKMKVGLFEKIIGGVLLAAIIGSAGFFLGKM